MIVFENDGEIDPLLISLIGVNVKESSNAIGFFGTGLKYVIACLSRWGESIVIQSGLAEFTFAVEDTEIRGRRFGIINMCSRYDRSALGFTTELGKNWEPWMVYRELWCNAHDEPNFRVYETNNRPAATAGLTRVIVAGDKIEVANKKRNTFILDKSREPLHVVDGLEIYEGPGEQIFYRGIAVQKLEKPALYTYNITEYLYLTEDRTSGTWNTDPIIARGLAALEDKTVINATILAPSTNMESRLDYDYVHYTNSAWEETAEQLAVEKPFDVPATIRNKFIRKEIECCPTCGRAYE